MLAKYLIIDTETTGLFFGKNGLIQVAAVVLDSELNEMDRYCQDVCPPDGFDISDEAMELTGFTLQRIQNGMLYEDFCISFLRFLDKHFNNISNDKKPIAVAQFYCFDWAFLNQVFTQCNLHQELNSRLGNDFIDTKALVNTLNLKAELGSLEVPFPITSLSKPGGLKDKLNIAQDTFTAHDALGDCLATKAVLQKLLDYLD